MHVNETYFILVNSVLMDVLAGLLVVALYLSVITVPFFFSFLYVARGLTCPTTMRLQIYSVMAYPDSPRSCRVGS
jgi:hypothetical protein